MAFTGDDGSKLEQLNATKYKDQAIWFLNAFWGRGPNFEENTDARDHVWEAVHKCEEIDHTKKEDGNELDEFQAHRLLEAMGHTLTVAEMRKELREIDIDFNRKVSLTEYLVSKFKVDWHVLVNASQGDNSEAVQAASAKLDAAKLALNVAQEAEAKATAAREAADEAKRQADEALADLQAKEKAHADAIAEKDAIGADESLGIVKRNKAKNEAAQLRSQDPMPLRTAKIHQEATTRKLQKALNKAGQAEAAAKAAAQAALATFNEAEQMLNDAVNAGGSAAGALWWLDKELEEARRRLPRHKLRQMEKEVAAAKARAQA